ncbi:H-NS histone family protein [Paraburkholderia sp. BL10I2N1]|uniref:H-NS histone family protein n=1 Tax=Paraburkholderia sp. BL10I2N1 TaxID=1938796 RepID=UPI00105F1CBC|nr:H-NS histone family protein [Paraburkholderia sp. BL10I2N1]TDN58869.1 DNA-binding protein H-NS [Paraburkholderia sp. BL10I2N1]
MDERKRESMIAYLRHRMEEFGIEPDDLAAAIASEPVKQIPARYQNATGDTWTGDGEMPQWLKQAISAGQRLEHFEMSSASPKADTVRKRIDWRDDPFAGSPLARQHVD